MAARWYVCQYLLSYPSTNHCQQLIKRHRRDGHRAHHRKYWEFSAGTRGGVTPAAPVPPDTCLSGLALSLGVLHDRAPVLVNLHFVFGITNKLAQLTSYFCLLDCYSVISQVLSTMWNDSCACPNSAHPEIGLKYYLKLH